jgi:hypothetical protein
VSVGDPVLPGKLGDGDGGEEVAELRPEELGAAVVGTDERVAVGVGVALVVGVGVTVGCTTGAGAPPPVPVVATAVGVGRTAK